MQDKNVPIAYRILDFHYSSNSVLSHGFPQCHLQFGHLDRSMKSLIFFQKVYKFHGLEFFSEDLLQQKQFHPILTCKPEVQI
jgi:hypothetical protein